MQLVSLDSSPQQRAEKAYALQRERGLSYKSALRQVCADETEDMRRSAPPSQPKRQTFDPTQRANLAKSIQSKSGCTYKEAIRRVIAIESGEHPRAA